MTVCANMKQCLTVLSGFVALDVQFRVVKGHGILVGSVGAGTNSKLELDSKGKEVAPTTKGYTLGSGEDEWGVELEDS